MRHGAIVVRVFVFVWLRSPTAPRRILGIPEALKLHAARHFPEPGPASLAGDAALRRPRPAPRPRLPRRLRRATSRADQVGQSIARSKRLCTERLRETSTAGITGGRVNGGGPRGASSGVLFPVSPRPRIGIRAPTHVRVGPTRPLQGTHAGACPTAASWIRLRKVRIDRTRVEIDPNLPWRRCSNTAAMLPETELSSPNLS